MKKPEIRKDYFRDDYVIIAPNRSKRPHKAVEQQEIKGVCPFCPETFVNQQIVYQDNGRHDTWQLVSVLNKYPVLTLDNHSAYGQAEVLIETPKHDTDINDLSIDHIVRVINAYVDRYVELRKIQGIKHVIVFKNEGGKAGASIAHSHSQIMALPLVPPKNEKEAIAFNKYSLEHGNCPYCDIISLEKTGPREVWQDENIFVLAPYASEAPFSVWIMPKRHINQMSALNHAEKESIAMALKIVLGRLDEYSIPYNYFFENSVNDEDYHMYIRVVPRPNVWAGLELGTGVLANPIEPEFAAKFYKGDILKESMPF